MPLTVRISARRTRTDPNEKRLVESSAQVMAPTRMKLRMRRRDNAAGGAGSGQPVEEEGRSREGAGRSSRRKNATNTSTVPAATSTSSPPTSSASASARAVMAAEEASPDSKCPICLDRFNNLAYLDRCLHRFCFPCIQEWSHNKPECPLCKQPFTSILHSVRAENDFKEYTLRPAPANSSVAATVAMVAAMASAARSDHQMRLTLRRQRAEDGGETTTRRRRRERGGRGGGSRRAGEGTEVLEWYLDSHSLPHPPHYPPISPVGSDDSDDGGNLAQSLRGEADLADRGVIFEGLTGLGGAVAPVAPNDRASRRLMSRLVARQRMQREGGTVRRLREREMVAFRRGLYRCGIRVRGVAGVTGNLGQQQRDVTAESFRQNSAHLNRLRPWLRRELTVLYGAHGVLVHIVQRIIMARLARHGLEDTPTIEEELRPFLLARTDHFLHELVSFARSPLSLDNYDLQAVYEPPAAALELDGVSSSSDSSSVIAISEGEEEERQVRGRSEERLQGRAVGAHDDDIQSGSCLSLSAWDDETPGPSYSTAEPSCSLASLSFSPARQEASTEGGGEKREEGEAEEECLIVGYKKPIAERTPELVQLSSDTEEEKDEEKKKQEEKVEETHPPLPSTTVPLYYPPTVPPSTSGVYRQEQDDKLKEKDGEADDRRPRPRSWSGSSGRSHESVFTLSPSERRRESSSNQKQSSGETARERRKRRERKRERQRERSSDWLRKSGTLYNPNRSIYPAMMHHRSRSSSPFHSSVDSASPSPPDSGWEYNCSPVTSSVSSPSHSSSSPLSSSPQLSLPPQTPPTPSLSPSNPHHGEKPGGKRKYKSRHLDSNDKDPTWKPSSSHRREKRRKRVEKERRKRRGRDGGRTRDRHRRSTHKESGTGAGESSRRCREERSPSVEIIYEGTITSDNLQPPSCKRRRKRHRKSQHTSSPIIITLDSDSSHDDVNNKHINSGSSSPLSSQQTVDFSDLPPLPLVHSATVGGSLDSEIGELPVDILDRGSDGSETEPVSQSETAGPITIDNKDSSDHEVDIENLEGSGLMVGCNDADKIQFSNKRKLPKKTITSDKHREAVVVDGGTEPAGENAGDLVMTDVGKRHSKVSTSDSHLLATVLNDLKGINASKCDFPFNFEPSCSPETRKRRFTNPCEVSQAHANQDGWLAERKHQKTDLPEERQSNSVADQDQGLDLPTCHTTIPLQPSLEQPKEFWVREESRGIPPCLKQASPFQLYNRNSLPSLKLKDGGSLAVSPILPVNIHSPHIADTDPVDINSSVGLNSNPTISSTDFHLAPEFTKNNQAVFPISAPKQHFTSTLALRKELVSTSSSSAFGIHSSCQLAPLDSHSAAPSEALTSSIHSSNKPAIDSHPSLVSENNSTSADSFSDSGFCSARSGSCTEKPADTDSTSGAYKNKTFGQNTCRPQSIDLHPCSSVSAEDTPAGSGVFSGDNCNNTSPLVSVSSTDSRTQNPNSSIDSLFCNEKKNFLERLAVSSAPNSRLSPHEFHPRSRKCAVEPHSSGAASEGLTNSNESLVVNCEDGSPHGVPPPIDLHSTSPAPLSTLSFTSTMTERHLNHTTFSSSPTEHSTTFPTSKRECSSQSKPSVASNSEPLHLTDSHSKPYNHFDPSSTPQLPTDTYSKQNLSSESQPPIDFHPKNSLKDVKLCTSNHITSSPQSVENQWNSNSSIDAHSDSLSTINKRSASSVWNAHTLPHRTDK